MNQSASGYTQFPLTIYYDASCRLCNAEMNNLMLRNQAGRLVFVDASSADLQAAPAPRAELMRAIHGVGADGIGWAWVPQLINLPGIAHATRLLYPVFARNRYRLPQAPVVWIFEQAMRRAARRHAEQTAARSAACASGSCELDADNLNPKDAK